MSEWMEASGLGKISDLLVRGKGRILNWLSIGMQLRSAEKKIHFDQDDLLTPGSRCISIDQEFVKERFQLPDLPGFDLEIQSRQIIHGEISVFFYRYSLPPTTNHCMLKLSIHQFGRYHPSSKTFYDWTIPNLSRSVFTGKMIHSPTDPYSSRGKMLVS